MLLSALIALLLAAACFVAGLAFSHDEDDMTRRILELERSASETERESKLVRSFVDSRGRAALDERFAEAGWYEMTVPRFVGMRIAAGLVCGVAGFFAALLLHLPAIDVLGAAMVGLVGAFLAPTFVLDGAVRKRKLAIERRLPDLLDMVATTVEAGTALNAAFAIAVEGLDGPIAEEFRMMLSDIRIGMPRADAFNAMARRVKQIDLSAVVTALVQTERLGGDVARVLNELAEEARSRRLARAEEIAAKMPVKMVMPMAFFMLPALFVMIFGPVAAELLSR